MCIEKLLFKICNDTKHFAFDIEDNYQIIIEMKNLCLRKENFWIFKFDRHLIWIPLIFVYKWIKKLFNSISSNETSESNLDLIYLWLESIDV